MSRFTHLGSLPRAERERRRKVARLTSARCLKFGAIPDDAAAWWRQMQTVAADMGIAIEWDEMQAPAPQEVKRHEQAKAGGRHADEARRV